MQAIDAFKIYLQLCTPICSEHSSTILDIIKISKFYEITLFNQIKVQYIIEQWQYLFVMYLSSEGSF